MDTEFTSIDLALPGGTSVVLALPAESEDPIVVEYKSGLVPNAYLTELTLLLSEPGDRMVDLGAHLGTLSVPAAALGRQVLAVDAAQLHVDAIRKSARLNGLVQLTAMQCAVGAEEGEVAFLEAGIWGKIELTGDTRARMVQCRRLDGILDELGWDDVSLIKLDIEGSELAAMRGCGQRLCGPGRPALIYESNGETFEMFGYSVPEMRRYLESIDYQTFRYEEGRLVYCAPDDLQPEMWLDVVALGPDHRASLRGRLDASWRSEKLVERCLLWGSLPHDNVKHYLARELAARPELVKGLPALRKLTRRLPPVDA